MFDRYFAPFLKHAERVHYASLDVYINYLRTVKSKILKTYGSSLGYLSPGIMTISQVLDVGMADQLAADNRDAMSMYLDSITINAQTAKTIFDPAYVGQIKSQEFVKGQGCTEYIFPVTSTTPMTSYPIGKPWEQWKAFRALRLVEIDTNELSYLSYLDRIQFHTDPPSYAIFTLDVEGLLLQRVAYLKSLTSTDADPISLYEWIHTYVVFPCLVNDMLTHWLMVNYDNLITTAPNQLGVIDQWSNGHTNAMSGVFQHDAFRDIYEMIRDNRNASLPLNRVLASMRLVDYPSVINYMDLMKSQVGFPQLLQYRWGEFMRDYRFMSIALKCAIASPKEMLSVSLGNTFPRSYQFFLQTRPWGVVDNTKARTLIENRMAEIGRLVDILQTVTCR